MATCWTFQVPLSHYVPLSKDTKLSPKKSNQDLSNDAGLSSNISDSHITSSLRQSKSGPETISFSKETNIHKTAAANATNNLQNNQLNISSNDDNNTGKQQSLGFQLRALSDDSAHVDNNLFQESAAKIILSDKLDNKQLSSELVDETLNYFVNCRQRLSQMTRTYDDSDAYLLLLQEKELDLELAARIGQDLLKQNKELKESIKNLEGQLAKSQDDVQQLKHELASKTSLLDTFMEEEEEQQLKQNINDLKNTSLQDESENLLPSMSSGLSIPKTPTRAYDEDQCPRGFLSLTPHKPCSSTVDPFTSLPYHINTHITHNDLVEQEASTDKVASTEASKQTSESANQKMLESVTIQLVENNKRLFELHDELLSKSEQSVIQKERIFSLEQQIRESDHRLDYIAKENESLRESILDHANSSQELYEELGVCKKNFNDLLGVFLELQEESRVNKKLLQQSSFDSSYHSPMDGMDSILFDPIMESTITSPPVSSSESDGADSGMHTTNMSNSITPQGLNTESDSDDSSTASGVRHCSSNHKETVPQASWISLSSFMITTFILICISSSLNSPPKQNS